MNSVDSDLSYDSTVCYCAHTKFIVAVLWIRFAKSFNLEFSFEGNTKD